MNEIVQEWMKVKEEKMDKIVQSKRRKNGQNCPKQKKKNGQNCPEMNKANPLYINNCFKPI